MPSAHEVEQFAYCAHNWALARMGHDGHDTPASRGETQDRLLRLVQLAARHERESRQATAVAVVLVAFAVLSVMGLLWALGSGDELLPYILVATCLVLLNLAIAALVVGQHVAEAAKRKRMEGSLGQLGVEAVAQEIRDPHWNLSGRLQFAIESMGRTVPVLVKSGKAPREPYESHRLQLACLLRLAEVRDGQRPNYGLIAYKDGLFAVAWDGTLEARLRETLARMEAARAASKADRDHEDPRRCRGCARRGACEQRLA